MYCDNHGHILGINKEFNLFDNKLEVDPLIEFDFCPKCGKMLKDRCRDTRTYASARGGTIRSCEKRKGHIGSHTDGYETW